MNQEDYIAILEAALQVYAKGHTFKKLSELIVKLHSGGEIHYKRISTHQVEIETACKNPNSCFYCRDQGALARKVLRLEE